MGRGALPIPQNVASAASSGLGASAVERARIEAHRMAVERVRSGGCIGCPFAGRGASVCTVSLTEFPRKRNAPVHGGPRGHRTSTVPGWSTWTSNNVREASKFQHCVQSDPSVSGWEEPPERSSYAGGAVREVRSHRVRTPPMGGRRTHARVIGAAASAPQAVSPRQRRRRRCTGPRRHPRRLPYREVVVLPGVRLRIFKYFELL